MRRLRHEVQPFVDLLTSEMPSDVEWHLLGSWRRNAPVVGDLDVLLVTETGELGGDLWHPGVALPPSVYWQRHGPKVAQGDLWIDDQFVHIDFWSCLPNERGAYLCFATGPMELNVYQRRLALRQGYHLSQIGLLEQGTKRQLDDGTERDIYRWLGMPYLEPEERERWTKPKQPTPKDQYPDVQRPSPLKREEVPMPTTPRTRPTKSATRTARKATAQATADEVWSGAPDGQEKSIDVGGVTVTIRQAKAALVHLSTAPGIMIKQSLAKINHPLAGCDYHAVARPVLAARPDLKGKTRQAFIEAVKQQIEAAEEGQSKAT